jgi:hypothetical protein
MKICAVGAELFHAERRTDKHDETYSRSSQLCEGSWNVTNVAGIQTCLTGHQVRGV